MQALAERNGISLSVGDIQAEDITPDFADTEGPQPKDVAARVVAHVMHRIPGVKRIEKRLEGKDNSSGIGSDVATLIGQLYARNKDQFDALATGVVSGVAHRAQSPVVVPEPGLTPDLGVVQPTSDNGGNHHA